LGVRYIIIEKVKMSMPEGIVRLARKDDVEAIYKLYFNPELNKRVEFKNMDLEEFGKIFEARLKSADYFVYEENGEVLGVALVLKNEGRIGHVRFLGPVLVHPERSGRGIGSSLVKTIFSKCLDEGATRIELTCDVTNEAAVEFYKKLGFETEGTLRNYLRIDGKYYDSYLMAILLDQKK